MSELKATTVYDAYWKAASNGDSSILVYLKSEADKVIEEKDKELRHQKFKRCLAMAKWCNEKWLVHNFAEVPTKLRFYDKWEKRWLEIADKFKEAK